MPQVAAPDAETDSPACALARTVVNPLAASPASTMTCNQLDKGTCNQGHSGRHSVAHLTGLLRRTAAASTGSSVLRCLFVTACAHGHSSVVSVVSWPFAKKPTGAVVTLDYEHTYEGRCNEAPSINLARNCPPLADKVSVPRFSRT